MDIINVMISGDVTRFHAVPGISPQSVSEHSWGVAILCQAFTPKCRKDVILAALTHDCAELITGDIPATLKWENMDIKTAIHTIEDRVEKRWGIKVALTPFELEILKIADCLEGMTYCMKRRRCGELEASVIFGRWDNYITINLNHLLIVEPIRDYTAWLRNQMDNANG